MKRLLLATALLLAALNAHGRSIDIAEYITTLEHIDASLAARQLDAARNDAKALATVEVTSAHGTFYADEPLLTAIARSDTADHQLRTRLAVTIEELRRAAPFATPPANPRLLTAVASEQEVPELAPGGEVPTTPNVEIPLLQRIFRGIGEALEWLGKKLVKLLDWLLDFLPREGRAGQQPGNIRWTVMIVTGLIVAAVVILAIAVLRRSKKDAPAVTESTEPVGSKRDENPLSRGATEWERYATQLAGEGRFREAVRAWYHAVLVTCYTSGILYFRKGRTNWEYMAALPPSLGWRADLIALTRRFELEWYGHEESDEESLGDCSVAARRILDAIRRGEKEAA
ncbi:MAG: hypothetical protein QOH21_3112 [Acidobacteriota bacterium]|jgi:hypothetical protein|nr:hypothetical protein [Acidobacteriota bacterium]